jgi:hypothetical protein
VGYSKSLSRYLQSGSDISLSAGTSVCNESGQVVSGIVDLVSQKGKVLVLIDHINLRDHSKLMAMKPESDFYAWRYSGQLSAYVDVLTNSSKQHKNDFGAS